MKEKNIKYFLLTSLSLGVFVLAYSFNLDCTYTSNNQEFSFVSIDSVYKFVKYSKNEIFNPNGLDSFFKKLDSVRNGSQSKINIIHLGDSHIQADLFSGELRRLVQSNEQIGNGGKGLVFPYSLAKTNNATWYKSSFEGVWETCRMTNPKCDKYPGMVGINAQTNDLKATFSIDMGVYLGHKYNSNSIKIYYPVQDSSMYLPVIQVNDSIFIESKIDSVNKYIEFIIPNAISKFKIGFKKHSELSSRFEIHGIVTENNQKGAIFHMIGLNGATIGTFLRYEKWTNVLKPLQPDLIIISLGTNDAYFPQFSQDGFKARTQKLISELKQALPNCSVLLTTPPSSNYKKKLYNPNYEHTARIMKEVAIENDIAIWNMYEVMGGKSSINKWFVAGLCQGDKLHFTRKGYELQAHLLHTALMKSYQNHCSLLVQK